MATDAGVTNITSTRVQYIFWDAVRSSCCLSDADLIFKGRIFFVGQWCHGSVGECTPGFFFLLPEQYRFASINRTCRCNCEVLVNVPDEASSFRPSASFVVDLPASKRWLRSFDTPLSQLFLEAYSGPRSLSVRYAQPGMAVPPGHVRVVQTSNEQARPKEAGSLVRTLT